MKQKALYLLAGVMLMTSAAFTEAQGYIISNMTGRLITVTTKDNNSFALPGNNPNVQLNDNDFPLTIRSGDPIYTTPPEGLKINQKGNYSIMARAPLDPNTGKERYDIAQELTAYPEATPEPFPVPPLGPEHPLVPVTKP